jgi:flagellar biosynthesis protein FliR
MVRVGLALGVTVLLLPAIEPSVPPVPEVSAQAGFMIVAEVITGLWIGWLARLLVLALAVAGQFIAYMLGVANVLQPDADLGGLASPIEQLFAKLKHFLRKAAARTIETVCAAIGQLLCNFTAAECANYFRNAGYC